MKNIAILSLKGGTAKTVTAATMARCLSAEHEKRVLLIDADQQGNLSQYFGVTDASDCCNTWQLLTEGAGYWPDFVTRLGPNLDLIPSGMELAQADLCQRQFEIVRKRRRNFVVFRRGGGTKTKRFLAQKECSRFAVSDA